jgi:UDP-N-acetylmuramoyl-tripeptide--D-alanyl-D-alanine ligase
MKTTPIKQIIKVMSATLLFGDGSGEVTGVSRDSREEIGAGDIFFAIVREKDGHDFIPDAISKGVRNFVVSRDYKESFGDGINVIKVDDTTHALQELAKWYMRELGIPKIGVAGSVGKTTTKDILYHIFSEKYNTKKTKGSENNEIGVPITILSFDEHTEVGIIETGIEYVGEMYRLVDIARPDIAIITNIGISHLATFGSRENIFKGEFQITEFFGEDNLLIVNEESDFLSAENVSGNYRLKTVGKSGRSNYIVSDIKDFGENGVEFTLEVDKKSYNLKLNIPGRHNAENAALAIAAAADMGITIEEAARGLLKIELSENRLNITGKHGIKVINDTYNASVDSMKAGVDVLVATKGIRKVAIFGDMFDLGDDSAEFHKQVGEYVASQKIDLVIVTGEMSKHIYEKAKELLGDEKTIYYDSREKLEAEIKKIIMCGDVVLVKGSRGMAMENVVKKILGD